MRIEKLPGGATAYYVGPITGPQRTCNCGRPCLPGENGCLNCMSHEGMRDFLTNNALRGDIPWARILELDGKFRKAGLRVMWPNTPVELNLPRSVMEMLNQVTREI